VTPVGAEGVTDSALGADAAEGAELPAALVATTWKE